MHRIQVLATSIALLAVVSVAGAQQTTPAGPVYPDTNVPDRAAPPTKDQLKAQKAQQKKEEKSADANAKAAKADAKAKKQHDKAVQADEKANPSTPTASAQPSATSAPQN